MNTEAISLANLLITHTPRRSIIIAIDIHNASPLLIILPPESKAPVIILLINRTLRTRRNRLAVRHARRERGGHGREAVCRVPAVCGRERVARPAVVFHVQPGVGAVGDFVDVAGLRLGC